jgi:hypothetical protein
MASSLSAGEPAAAARRLAREILAEGRFHKPAVPRPLHSALQEIGRALESPLNGLGELVDKLGNATPGGSGVVWGALAVVVLITSAVVSSRGARRALHDVAPIGGDRALAPLSASDLEREAVAAERSGRYAEAVRYRFRAGLMRLADTAVVSDAPAMVNANIARALGSPAFDHLARRFDEITYGGRAASEEDVQHSRREWARVLATERGR